METTVRNSPQWVALRMLKYAGIASFDLPPTPDPTNAATEPGLTTYLSDGDLDDIAGIQTAALQEITDDGPGSLSEIGLGASLYPPTTITLNVVNAEDATVLVSGWQPWMTGCAVLIAGDQWVNEFLNGSGLLRRPYLGPTALSVQATVFCTSVQLKQDIKNVVEPVRIGGSQVGELYPCPDRSDYDAISGCYHLSCSVRTGLPVAYIVEHAYDETLDYLPTFLRVAPAPQCAMPLIFRAKLNPLVITADDLGDNDSDPATPIPMPGRWIESVFLPYCLQRFTAHPLFKNEAAKPEIARQYQSAKNILAGHRPQSSRSGRAFAFRP